MIEAFEYSMGKMLVSSIVGDHVPTSPRASVHPGHSSISIVAQLQYASS